MMYLPRLSAGTRRSAVDDIPQAFHRAVKTAQASGSHQSSSLFQPGGLTGTRVDLDVEIPFYGHYCGPGFGDPKGCEPAIDEVDRVCCRHDHCYREHGSHDCECERELLANIGPAMAKEAARGNVAAVSAGEIIRNIFLVKPCVCGEICIPFAGCVPIISPTPLACIF